MPGRTYAPKNRRKGASSGVGKLVSKTRRGRNPNIFDRIVSKNFRQSHGGRSAASIGRRRQGKLNDAVSSLRTPSPVILAERSRVNASLPAAPQPEPSFGERLLSGGIAGLIDEDFSADAREFIYGDEDPSPVQLALAAPLPIGKAAQIVARGVSAARGARAGQAAVRGEQAAETAARGAQAAARAEQAADAAKGAATGWSRIQKGSQGVREAAQAAAKTKPGKVAKGAGKAAGGAAKVATYPLRHPIKYAKWSAIAQAPIALTSEDPVGKYGELLQTGGVAGDAYKALGELNPFGEGIASNAYQDLTELPSQVIPSTFLTGKAVAEGIGGDWGEAEKLWEDYTDTGLLPGIVKGIGSGDFGQAENALYENPLYSALEVRGAQAGAGRAAGAALRAGAGGKRGREIADRNREPLELGGGLVYERQPYSPDLIEQRFQKRADRKREEELGGQRARSNPRLFRASELDRILNERGDRGAGIHESVRRRVRDEEQSAAEDARPGRARRSGLRSEPIEQRGVSYALKGIVRSPETMEADLDNYGARLDRSHADLQAARAVERNPVKKRQINRRIEMNREKRQEVEDLRGADAATVFAGRDANAPAMRQHDTDQEEFFGQGERMEQSRMIPAARVHLDAQWGRSNETQATIDKLMAAAAMEKLPRAKASLEAKARSLGKHQQLIAGENTPGAKAGDALPPEKLAPMLRKAGVDTDKLAFISGSPTAGGPGAFYRSFFPNRAGLKESGKLTGQGVIEGAWDSGYDTVVEQRLTSSGAVQAARSFDQTIQEGAVTRINDGKWEYANYREANDAASSPEEFGFEDGVKLVPVRRFPMNAKADEKQATSRSQLGDEDPVALFEEFEKRIARLDPGNQDGMDQLATEFWANATKKGEGPYVLMPETHVARLKDHFAAAGTGRKLLQAINPAFKSVVLPFQPSWWTGNFFDVNMRTMFEGTTPYGRNARLGKKLLDKAEAADPQKGAQARAALAPGSMFGSIKNQQTHRDARQFAGTSLHGIALAFGSLRRVPGVKSIVNLHKKATQGLFSFNEKFIERQSQYAMLGKAAREDVRAQTGKWHSAMRMSDDAVHDLAKGLLKTETQIRYAKRVEQALGQWTANSPDARRFLVDFAPFGMWTRAASRFVFWTLPAKHPIKLGIVSIVEQMTEEERIKLGLTYFTDRPLPPNLQGSVPGGFELGPLHVQSGGVLPVQSLTSFGYFSDYQKALASAILPQFELDALRGYDWTGEKLTHEDGTPLNVQERTGAALAATLETYVPGLSMIKRITEKGPGTLSPFKPVPAGLVDHLRDQANSISITVPAPKKGDSSSSESSTSSSETSSAPSAPSWSGSGSSSSSSPSSSGSSASWSQ